jgi:hypothetical protein
MMLKLRPLVRLTLVLPVFVSLLVGCARIGDLVNPQPGPSTQAPDAPVSNEDQPAGGAAPSPLDPIPGEDKMARGEATISESDVLLLESYPVQVRLNLKGTLSTPCHYLRAKVNPPDAQNRIQIEVYSLYNPDEICIQMLQEFETSIPLGSYPDGSYTVWLNGKQVGEFTQ